MVGVGGAIPGDDAARVVLENLVIHVDPHRDWLSGHCRLKSPGILC